jgi:glycosyltransferase involved in cell wall biosynthesis
MLIGIDASRYRHEQPTGVEVYSDEIIDGLLALVSKQQDHQVRLYSPKPLEGISEENQRVLPQRRLWTRIHLSREMKKNPPNVLFVPSHVLPKHHPQKSVITIHDVAFTEFPKAYSAFQRFYLKSTTKYAVKHAWKIIVPSQSTADDLISKFNCDPSKIVKVPHGYRPKTMDIPAPMESEILKKFHLSKTTPYVFFVGRLETKKNISRLIQAFAQFHESYPEWRLILGGGRGVGFKGMLKALEKENVLKDVLMPGYLDEDEKQVLLTNAKLFAFPSLSEGFGLPILEAASHKVPILASRIPALLDFEALVDEFVDPMSVDSIAEAMNKLASAKPHSNKSVTQYSWEKAAKSTWDLLTT